MFSTIYGVVKMHSKRAQFKDNFCFLPLICFCFPLYWALIMATLSHPIKALKSEKCWEEHQQPFPDSFVLLCFINSAAVGVESGDTQDRDSRILMWWMGQDAIEQSLLNLSWSVYLRRMDGHSDVNDLFIVFKRAKLIEKTLQEKCDKMDHI